MVIILKKFLNLVIALVSAFFNCHGMVLQLYVIFVEGFIVKRTPVNFSPWNPNSTK